MPEFDPCEIWMDTDHIRGLSHLEARILAADWGWRAATAARLPAARASDLVDLLRMELTGEMDRIHARGGTSDRGWFRRAFRSAFERVIAKMGPLSPAKVRSLRQSLQRSLG